MGGLRPQLVQEADVLEHPDRLIERRHDDGRAELYSRRMRGHVGAHRQRRRAQAVVREMVLGEPGNLEARLNMLWASYYGGASIAHAGTHLVHAMSYPLGGK